MIKFIQLVIIFYLSFSKLHGLEQSEDQTSLRINIFSASNGKGLENSRKILKEALIHLGHEVYERELTEIRGDNDPTVDINIFFEIINDPWIPLAAKNWFIPNPEWYQQDIALLQKIDLILCRTYEVEKIFKSLKKKTYYLGFSSVDCKQPGNKDFSSCFHLSGSSTLKGTSEIMKAWNNDLLMPNLTIVIHYDFPKIIQDNLVWITQRIPQSELLALQNECGIHLCLSETEGYGHYLMEAMSTGAVVVTTDAPPMNEFIKDKRCLIPYKRRASLYLGILYFANPNKLHDKMRYLLSLSQKELQEIGDNNRKMYLEKTQIFHKNLKKLMSEVFR